MLSVLNIHNVCPSDCRQHGANMSSYHVRLIILPLIYVQIKGKVHVNTLEHNEVEQTKKVVLCAREFVYFSHKTESCISDLYKSMTLKVFRHTVSTVRLHEFFLQKHFFLHLLGSIFVICQQ